MTSYTIFTNRFEVFNIKYYLVAPADKSYHSGQPLTYSCPDELEPGQVVKITVRKKFCLGVVISPTNKPKFLTSNIDSIIDMAIDEAHLSLLGWMVEYYPGSLGRTTSFFLPAWLEAVKLIKKEESNQNFKKPVLPALSDDQTAALDEIEKSQSNSFLLHGDTGSGKTRVYIELAAKALKDGKSALILTPEISLTAPLKKHFDSALGQENIVCLHSNLTPAQKKKIWAKILFSKDPLVVIGPRSALFSPVKKLGLIVVDESHDQAYKEEASPYFYGLRVASKLAQLTGSLIVFGSGTPLVNEYYLARQKNIPIIRMKKLAVNSTHKPLPTKIINLADKHEKSSHWPLSQSLLKEIELSLTDKKQVLVFLNKRGSARSVVCQNCGWKNLCPNCDNSLIYHQDSHKLQCHTCGFRGPIPLDCPECSSKDILFKNPGTKAVQASLEKIFPKSKVARFDGDNKKAERMEEVYEKVIAGEIDIIVGTQLITKGHDLPNLSLAAIISADSGLDFPDFTSEERSYQLISQLKGRINRGHVPGRLVVQTYNPDSDLLKDSLNGKYTAFYDKQLSHRKKLGFPPFVHAMKIEVSKSKREAALQSISKLAESLSHIGGLRVIGPSPSFVEKKAKKYHWQIIVTSKKRSALTEAAEKIPASFKSQLDPLHFL